MKKILGDEELRNKVCKIIEEAGKPVSVGYVAKKMNLSWSIARTLLLLLAAKGDLGFVETTRGFVFYLVNIK